MIKSSPADKIKTAAASWLRFESGFALVTALALMAFILLLLVSMASLIQVELYSGTTERKHFEARQNALLGLRLAMGELQRTAGPDQRVTAPANLFEENYGPVHATAAWTGVWHSREQGGRADDFLGWLVSGSESSRLDPEFPAQGPGLSEPADPNSPWTADSNDWVILLGRGSVDEPSKAVVAPLVAIEENSVESGHYAYWVGEEAIKARINLNYSPADANDLVVNTLSNIPPYTAYTRVNPEDWTGLGPDSAAPGRILSLSDLQFFDPPPENSLRQRYFHDFTTHSRGLLTNTRLGGMRSDLTHLFENDQAFIQRFGGDGPDGARPPWEFEDRYLFLPDGYEAPSFFNRGGGPNWGILKSFYQLKERISFGRIMPFFFPNDHNPSTPSAYNRSSRPFPRNRGYHIDSAVFPVLSRVQMGIGVHYHSEAVADSDEVRFFPEIRLRVLFGYYNPYDIPLMLPEASSGYSIEINFNPKIRIHIEGQNPVEFRLREVLPIDYDEDDDVNPETGILEDGTVRLSFTNIHRIGQSGANRQLMLHPGEMRYISNRGNQYYDSPGRHLSDIFGVEWDADHAIYFRPTEDGNIWIRSSVNTGATSTGPSRNNTYFGLNPTEVANLQWQGDTDDQPPVTISISYDPVNYDPDLNIGDPDPDNEGTLARTWYRVEGSTTQYFYENFQQTADFAPDLKENSFPNLIATQATPVIGGDIGYMLRTTRLPTAGDEDQPHRIFVDANLRAPNASVDVDLHSGPDYPAFISGWTGLNFYDTVDLEPEVVVDGFYADRNTGYFGSGTMGMGASPITILYHVPREPIVSLGTLQHAMLGRYTRHPNYIIGSSYALARLPLGETAQNAGRIFDWPYIINRDLWDAYYFSTIPQDIDTQDLDALIRGDEYLPNPRLSFQEPEGFNLDPDMLTDYDDPDTAQLVAAMQVIEGPFNVNSTSEKAWKAFLASNSDLQIPLFEVANFPAGAMPAGFTNESDVVFSRTPITYLGHFDTEDDDSAFWSAYRRLDDNEINELAREMVEEVRARGPFSSIADFVNRRLSGPDELRRRGALQAALDRAINSRLSEMLVGAESGADLAIGPTGDHSINPEDRPGTAGTGWITQGDVLQVLGPLLAVRSDTFTIRSYGDVVNPLTGVIEARAWCEAIVQRVATPVTVSGIPTIEELLDAPHPSGRYFRIVAFRWLNENEI